MTENDIQEKEYKKYLAAFQEWLERDYWTPKEFANMLLGFRPESGKGVMGFFCKSIEDSDAVNKLQDFIRKCASETLSDSIREGKDDILLLSKKCLGWKNDQVKTHAFWHRVKADLAV